MPHDRFYADTSLEENTNFTIDGDEFHHLSRVMRAKEGEVLECFNGRGVLAKATIKTISKKEAELQVISVEKHPFPDCPLIIAEAYLRVSKLDLILEKGCELGMNALWLFKADHSEKGDISPTQWKRINHVLVSACKQCGQLWLPEVKLIDGISRIKDTGMNLYFGDTDVKAPWFEDAWKSNPPKKGAVFFVGPERGFSDKEVKMLNKIGAVGVKLNRFILRTETAPLAAMSLMGSWRR